MRAKVGSGHSKCYGSATVGPRGQVVIPVEARKEMSIEAGSRFLVFRHPHGKGILLIKSEAIEAVLTQMGGWMAQLEQAVKNHGKATKQR
ncbi:AbrB/MazE/SpoVT family DNA-binding domain-containing protein [Chloroflexota bacterium]